jgi:hypothetical protein
MENKRTSSPSQLFTPPPSPVDHSIVPDIPPHSESSPANLPSTSAAEVDQDLLGVMQQIDEMGALTLPKFVALTKLPPGKLYTVTKLVKRVKGEEGAPYTGIHLYLDDEIRTGLPRKLSFFPQKFFPF